MPEINAHLSLQKIKLLPTQIVQPFKCWLRWPLQKEYGIDRLVISTYQSITGTGVAAVRQLENEYENKQGEMALSYSPQRSTAL